MDLFGTDADNRPILVVHALDFVCVLAPAVYIEVGFIPVGKSSKAPAREVRDGTQVEAVDDKVEGIDKREAEEDGDREVELHDW